MRSSKLQGVRSSRYGLLAAAAVFATLFVAGFSVAAPPAGTSIGNQASATYTDSSAVPRTVTSGTVTTIVQQVASLDLSASQSRLVSPGGTINFPHTLTNTGNGTDTFSLAAVDFGPGNITFTALKIYPDANADGVPDSFTEITDSGALAAGSGFTFVVAATVPGGAPAADLIKVTATSLYVETPADLVVSASNDDNVTVTGNALVNITKAASASAGPSPFGPMTYTITYTNTGNSAATAVTITDTLAAGISYVAGSGLWSVTGVTALTEATGDVQPAAGSPNIDYSISISGDVVTAVIDSIGSGQSGTISFRVMIGAGLAPGVINNVALLSYNDGSGTQSGSSNTVGYTVVQTAAVTVYDTGSLTDEDLLPNNDVIFTEKAVQGAIVPFDVVIYNGGNGTDSFTLTYAGSTDPFPLGTTFLLYQAGGFTPLVGSLTPPVAAGGSYHVVVKANLPSGATGAGPFDLTVTGTSVFDPTKSNPTTIRLGTITSSTVDLTQDLSIAGGALAANGLGAGPEPLIASNSANPGASTTFKLYVNNTSGVADGYDLAASANSAFSASLPAGWTAVFKEDGGGACATTGATITATGVLTAGASRLVCAVVSVPAGAVAGATAVYFRALSPTTGAGDSIHDQVVVNAIRSIVVAPPNPGQVFPGGTVTYKHTIRNAGNVTEGTVPSGPNGTTTSVVLLGTSDSRSADSWSSLVYWDKNNDGALDVGDPEITDLSQLIDGSGGASTAAGLAPGETATLFVKVFAPLGASAGDVDATTLRASVSGTINSVAAPADATTVDTSTVIAGQIRLDKLQALDADCNGTADTGFSSADITVGALPGACIRYRITAINDGTGDVTTVVVSDATPANTTLDCGAGSVVVPATTLGSIAAPACGATGMIQATVGTMNPTQQAVVTFGVKINP